MLPDGAFEPSAALSGTPNRLTAAVHHVVTAPPVTAEPPATGLPVVSLPDFPPLEPLTWNDPPEPASEPTAPESPVLAVSTFGDAPDRAGLTENGLPRRVRQASLALQLREATVPPSSGGTTAGSRSPEQARSVMSAFRRGWQRGLSDADTGPGPGPDLTHDGESR